jgi:RNA polymerase sigma factor (sigma-70 family)
MFGRASATSEVDLVKEHDDWTAPSWEQLVRDHSDMVYRVALRLTGNPADAEDLTQDVFIKAFNAVNSFQPGVIDGWLRRITTNLFLDQTRRRKRLRFDPMEGPERVISNDPGPAQAYTDNSLDHDVARALADLTPDHRVAVVLCDIEGLTYDEIAQVLDIKLSTVRNRIQRGRAALRASLAHRRPTNDHPHVLGAPDERPGEARRLHEDPVLSHALRR